METGICRSRAGLLREGCFPFAPSCPSGVLRGAGGDDQTVGCASSRRGFGGCQDFS